MFLYRMYEDRCLIYDMRLPREFEVMCNVLSISVCPLSSLSPPSSCCVVSCLSDYPRNCLSVSRVFGRVKKRQLNKVWNMK